jgi:hypothetical protein
MVNPHFGNPVYYPIIVPQFAPEGKLANGHVAVW